MIPIAPVMAVIMVVGLLSKSAHDDEEHSPHYSPSKPLPRGIERILVGAFLLCNAAILSIALYTTWLGIDLYRYNKRVHLELQAQFKSIRKMNSELSALDSSKVTVVRPDTVAYKQPVRLDNSFVVTNTPHRNRP